MSVVNPGLAEAQRAVDREANISGIFVFLAVVLPPANRAQAQSARRFQRLIAAARTAIADFSELLHRA